MRWLKNQFHLLQAILANLYYGFPSRKLVVVGITGTDGKTTTTHLVAHILKATGLPVDFISTVSAPGLHTTTPDSWVLQKFLRLLVNQKIKYVILESTSHGLDQNRLWGINYAIGVVTNITHEHLDYHKTYDNYLQAKAKLFRNVGYAILNRDDASYKPLKLIIENSLKIACPARVNCKLKIISYGLHSNADVNPQNFEFITSLPGIYNKYNCLAAISVAKQFNLQDATIRKAVADFTGIPGRMEEVALGQRFRVVVDFAHTPNGLKNALLTLKSQLHPGNKLIAVFGCAGLRDTQKRPLMGKISSQLADQTILTAEDPRTEDVGKIIKQISKPMEHNKYQIVPDRRSAIMKAFSLARPGDIVGIFGKGHEQSICYGNTERYWSDREEARKALQEIVK